VLRQLLGDAVDEGEEKWGLGRGMAKKYYAHSLDGKPPSDWQPLEEHLKNVAEMARLFADAFGAGDWGYLAGLKKRPFSGASGQRYYRWGGLN